MSDKEKCARCGEDTPTYEFEYDSTFWGFITHETTTETTRRLRIQNDYYTTGRGKGSQSMMRADERQALCSDCSGLLIGFFLQGRAVPALDSREKREEMRRIADEKYYARLAEKGERP